MPKEKAEKLMRNKTQQSEQPLKRGRDVPFDGPAPRKKAKPVPQAQLPQLAFFPELQQAAG